MLKGKGLFYVLVLLVHISARLVHLTWLADVTKPLLMPVLIWLVWSSSLNQKQYFLLLALFFSLCGDVLLMFSGSLYFMLGLGAFLLAHVCYIVVLSRYFVFNGVRVLPFVAFSSLMIFGVLNGQLPVDLEIPVGFYVLTITVMGIFAVSGSRLSPIHYEKVLAGAVLFILSDSFIAVDKFVNTIPFASFWVMSTYGMAQYLMVSGLTSRGKES